MKSIKFFLYSYFLPQVIEQSLFLFLGGWGRGTIFHGGKKSHYVILLVRHSAAENF